MIKLKDILKKILKPDGKYYLQEGIELTKEQKTTSWLSPTGEFVFAGKNHEWTAAQIVYNITGKHDRDAREHLWKLRWMRVSYYTRGILYCHNEVQPPNDLQKRLLIDLTKEIGFEELIYDDGESGFPSVKILWSKKDTLQEVK